MAFDLSRSYVVRLEALQWDRLNAIYADMEYRGRNLLLDAGVSPEAVRFIRSAEMRYIGQGFEVGVTLPGGEYDQGSAEGLRRGFENNYRGIYRRLCENIPIECVNWRLTATGPSPDIGAIQWWSTESSCNGALKGHRRAYLPEAGRFGQVPVYDRYRLSVGTETEGPAIVEERESTLVINGPGKVRVDEFGNIILTIG